MDNLARSANYTDVNLFTYEMEAKNGVDSLDVLQIDDIKWIPVINHLRITTEVYRGDKKIATVPAIYNKKEEVISFKENIKIAQNKLKRLVRSFEETMCNHIVIDYDKLMLISKDYIIKNVLSKLILLSNENVPLLFKEDHLETLKGKEIVPSGVYIAHPIELKKYGVLQECINYIIRNNIKQPFKQVLREFYIKSEIELAQTDVWRFRGFNVDLKKCIAALKGHGWGISEDVGLRKVFYHQNTVAILFREFDDFYTYDFTDVNRELHTITFVNRKTEEIIQLKDEKLPSSLNESNCNIVKEKEANAIIAKLNSPNSYTFVLDEKGKEYTSVELSEKINKVMTMGNSTINFVIGGSLGLTDSVRNKGNETISFSRLTFPHQMIRMFLLEQIFRSFKILNNETYHH